MNPCVEIAALLDDIGTKRTQETKAFLNGVLFYKNHPFSRQPQEGQIVFSFKGAHLRRYGDKDGIPILIIPSLINSADILDLFPEASLIRYLLDQKYQVYCIEWGSPDSIPLSFGIAEYFSELLCPFFEFVCNASDTRPHLIGYCMGGIFALLLAQFESARIHKIALLAPPFDFSVEGISYDPRLLALWTEWIERTQDHIPSDFIPYVFFIKKPFQFIEKYSKFNDSWGEMAQKLFVSIEDWLNTPMNLARQVGLDALNDWFLRNALKENQWFIHGLKFQPSVIQNQVLLVSPKKDSVVPPHSNLPLKEFLPNCHVLQPDLGHVGIVSNPKARLSFWPNLSAFLDAPKKLSILKKSF